ncbi:DUF6343 family protein [Streptomyces albus]|uniref:Uncharacterized protein n=2 Tax=Streptomyces albus TaxID=1888 RepID=A0A6C1C1Z4_9ACTN|nr:MULTISPECIES: DUF6343 family protein [Streptomyces]KPC65733.1 hypothetical protein ADL27_59720 [Streptomyces sp. NRRL F-6602]EPD96744.1 hypothetical protein HMPREF1486_00603 [Streptomyces sp. HPH0547]MDI6412119.1 DUF6343 family protein [Streptomyces albus]QID35086.1 hypothetical protein G3260_000990 [Streptomyces albus]TGG76356.1 hypothetical protein D8771_30670 [Streptomyces albus]
MSQPPSTGPHRDDDPGHRRPRSGTEPVTARSDLWLRTLLSSVGLPFFAAAAAALAWWATASGPHDSPSDRALSVLAAVCGLLALGAAVDLVVLRRRRAQERAARGREKRG